MVSQLEFPYRNLVICSESELNSLNRFVHDSWFDVNEITFSKEKQICEVPFWRREVVNKDTTFYCIGREYFKIVEYTIFFMNVMNMELNDHQGVKFNSFNEIYHDENNILKVETNVPMTFKMKVETLKITVQQNKVVKNNFSISLFGFTLNDFFPTNPISSPYT